MELLKRARLELALRSALGCLSPPSPGPVFWLSNPIKAPLDGEEPAAGGHACEEQGRANLLLQHAQPWLFTGSTGLAVDNSNFRQLPQTGATRELQQLIIVNIYTAAGPFKFRRNS